MKIKDDEYLPLIEYKNQKKKFYAIFYDSSHNLNKIEITEEIFLQFFGIHKMKIINEKKCYFISYKDNINMHEIQLTETDYKSFNSFKSQSIKHKNIYSKYIEHFEQTNENLQKRVVNKPERIEEILYKRELKKEIIKALKSLKIIQRKRFIMYYLEDMTYEEIAIIEKCSKQAVKYSIDIAKKHLKEKLNEFYFYT